jgi:hypothetical protein
MKAMLSGLTAIGFSVLPKLSSCVDELPLADED